ncbi:hypothetical protein G6F37_005543 [Rhizopus arrhizus]|nr:hypothetical protein G6F37_005543 [Rhizopus arrhizus]
MSSIDPSQTLYITNIKGRANVEEIKACLYGLFSTYGPILDIVIKKTEKMREQAFVVYNSVASATTAKRGLNGFTFLGHALKIEYSKTKSDAVAKLDGTYRLRDSSTKRAAEEEREENPSKMAKTEDRDEEDEDSDDDHA